MSGVIARFKVLARAPGYMVVKVIQLPEEP